MAEENEVTILSYIVIDGYGCFNHGIMLESGDTEKFLNHLTMALMPARWSKVSDNDPAVVAGLFGMI